MIYCLTGKIVKKSMNAVVLSCGGVGYYAQCPASVAGALPGVGKEATIYTVMSVTENDVSLYGFATEEQQACFEMLTAVSGVGPKVGLAILSVMEPDRVALAISAGDHKAFKAASGVGPKLAQRIVLELKDKVAKGFVDGISLEDVAAVRPLRRWCRWGTARAKQRLPFPRSTRHCPWKRSSNWPCAAWQAGGKECRTKLRCTAQK
jgi:Holliday junction DNA helicase RuvA